MMYSPVITQDPRLDISEKSVLLSSPSQRIRKSINDNAELDSVSNGKRSIALNLKDPKGVSILKILCKHTDVLREPFGSGVMESLKLGPEIMLMENPSLIYVRLTGFGQEGSYSQIAGHEINYVAMSGLLSLFGRRNEKPMFTVNLTADLGGGGLMCAFGIMLALYERTRSSSGQVVDCSMTSGSAYLGRWLFRSQSLPIWGQPRGQNILDGGSHFYDTYEIKDGKYVSVSVLEPQFYSLLIATLGIDPDEVPQFGSFEEYREIFSRKFKEKTRNEWEDIFKSVVPFVAPVLSLEEAANHRQSHTFGKVESQIVPSTQVSWYVCCK